MYNDNIGQDGISERKAQFEKGMATIASSYQSMIEIYRAKAEIDMEQIRANIEGITEKQNKTELLLQEVAEGQKKTDKLMRQHDTNWGRWWSPWSRAVWSNCSTSAGSRFIAPTPDRKCPTCKKTARARTGNSIKEVVVVEVNDAEASYQAVRRVDEGFFKVFSVLREMRVYGAVAYIRCDSDTEGLPTRGLYVIRATGDSASI